MNRPNTAAALVAALLLATAPAARGSDGAQLSYEVKAGFLYNFIKFTEWPAPAAAPVKVTIAVLGDARLAEIAAADLAGKTARGLPVHVVGIAGLDELRRELGGVQLLFLGPDAKAHEEAALALAGGRPVLTVGESPDFCRLGGIVRLFRQGERLRFEISPGAARRAGLRLSSQLLGLAVIHPDQAP